MNYIATKESIMVQKYYVLKTILSKKPWKNMAQGSDKFWKRMKIMGKN